MRNLMLVVLFAALHCSGPYREALTLHRLCVNGNFAVGAEFLSVGQPVRFSVSVDPNRSCRPLCDTVVESRCALTRDGNSFRVDARVVVDVECNGSETLPSCSAPGVECTTPPLDAGEYTVTDGVRTLRFRVPTDLPSPATGPCAG